MRQSFIVYVDMDGVLNYFEKDPDARTHMWTPGYFRQLELRKGMNEVLQKINKECYVIILTKVINRVGVTAEKIDWVKANLSDDAYSDMIFVPYDRSKADYMYSYYPSMLIDDKETNLIECAKKGSYGVFMSDVKMCQKFVTVRNVEEIYEIYQRRIKEISMFRY